VVVLLLTLMYNGDRKLTFIYCWPVFGFLHRVVVESSHILEEHVVQVGAEASTWTRFSQPEDEGSMFP
jgi:hypothetical protein